MSRRTRRRLKRQAERRAMSYGPVPLNDSHTLFGNYPMTSTGLRVDNYSANCNIVFRRCCEIIAESFGKMSKGWRLFRGDGQDRTFDKTAREYSLVTRSPNSYTTSYNFWVLLFDWAESWGNGYAWILRNRNLQPIGLFPLHPSRVRPFLVLAQTPGNEEPWELVYQIDGGRENFVPYEILHIKGNPGFDGILGYNPVQLHENSLAIAQAQTEYAGEFFQNQATAGGLIELPSHLAPEVIKMYREQFQNQYSSRGNRHRLAIVDNGVKFTSTTINPENAQLLESRKFSVYEICLLKGVPLTMLGDMSHGTFNTEQQTLNFSTVKIHPQAENLRQELDLKLTPSADYGWSYNLKDIDAADTTTRTNRLKTAVGGPWMTKEEAREEDGLPSKIDGVIYPPANMTAPAGPEHGGEAGKGTGDGGQGAGDNDPPENASAGSTEGENRKKLPAAGVETRSLKARQRAASSLEPIFRDTADRLTTKEVRAVGNLVEHLKKGNTETFLSKLEDFYNRHYENVRDAFLPSLIGLATQVKHAVGDELQKEPQQAEDLAQVYAGKMATRHCDHAKHSLAAVLAANTNPAAAAVAVEDRLAHWNDNKSEAQADYELCQASNFFARETYKANSVQSVRWISAGCGPECKALDGKKVPIDQAFMTEPLRWHPPFNGECQCGIIAD